jgi:hypothetical protein
VADRHPIESQVPLLETVDQDLFKKRMAIPIVVELAIFGLHYEKIAKRICSPKPLVHGDGPA